MHCLRARRKESHYFRQLEILAMAVMTHHTLRLVSWPLWGRRGGKVACCWLGSRPHMQGTAKYAMDTLCADQKTSRHKAVPVVSPDWPADKHLCTFSDVSAVQPSILKPVLMHNLNLLVSILNGVSSPADGEYCWLQTSASSSDQVS